MILDLLIGAAAACVASLQWASARPSADGAVPLSLMTVPPLGCIAIVLGACILRGRFDGLPGGRAAAFLLAVGILAAFWFAMAASADGKTGEWRLPAAVACYAILAACVAVIHDFGMTTRLASMLLGGVALGGWTLCGYGIWQSAAGSPDNRQAKQEIRLSEIRYAYSQIPEDAPLCRHLSYIDSEEPAVRQQARDRCSRWQNLDDELIACLATGGWSLQASAFLAHVHPGPSARFALAFEKFLKAELASWKERFPGPLRSEWKVDLDNLILAAERIQKAGGDLREPLQAWAEFLRTDPQLVPYAPRVQSMIH
jgi:hypothetical protein